MVNIWKVYKYIFYQTYRWQQIMWGSMQPDQWTLIGMSFTFLLYFSAVGMFMSFVGFDYVGTIVDSNTYTYGLLVIIPLFHYFLFLYKGRFNKIIKEFKTDSYQENTKGLIIFWVYVIGSMISFFIAGYLMHYSVNTGFTLMKYFGFK